MKAESGKRFLAGGLFIVQLCALILNDGLLPNYDLLE
jgi:hypothetical protein